MFLVAAEVFVVVCDDSYGGLDLSHRCPSVPITRSSDMCCLPLNPQLPRSHNQSTNIKAFKLTAEVLTDVAHRAPG